MNEAPQLDESQEAGQSPDCPVCVKCEAPVIGDTMAVCQNCGWYPSAGIFVDIDREWEAACAGQPVAEERTGLDLWMHLVPVWVWPLVGCFVATLLGSLAVRLLIEDEKFRSSWATHQFVIALGVQVICHFFANFVMSIADPDIGVFDAIISPTKSWRKMFAALPKRLWIAGVAVFALGAILGAKYVIGGVDLDHLWDWNIKAPAKSNLLAAIADAAPGGGEDDMEDAMKSFAEDAAVGGPGGAASKFFDNANKEATGPIERKKTDALILGYILDGNGGIAEFLIATEVNTKLMYAGRVQPNFTPDQSAEVLERLRTAHTGHPLVSAPEGAQWVHPRFPCRVTYYKRVESGRLQGLLWEEMLGEVRFPW